MAKVNIDPRIRAKLEELGVDTVKAKFVSIMAVRTLAQQDDREPLGEGLTASRQEMQEWLRQKAAREAWWLRVATIAAVAAAVIALAAALIAYEAWRFPVSG